jgi:hypothetical protein
MDTRIIEKCVSLALLEGLPCYSLSFLTNKNILQASCFNTVGAALITDREFRA